MKRHINGFYALLLLVSCINNVKAQQYYSILDHVNKWAIFTVEIGVGQERSFFGGSGYLSSQDTIMDSLAYKWIIPDNNFFYYPDDTLKYFLREDTATKQIFIRNNDTVAEFLIFDFNMLAGDSIFLQFRSNAFSNSYFKVDSLSSLSTMAGMRTTWHLSNSIHQKIVWIEGIGSIYGPIYTANMFCPDCIYTNCDGQIYTNLFLTCAFKDTIQVYQNSICEIPPVWQAIPINNCLYMSAGGLKEANKESYFSIDHSPNNGIMFLKINSLGLEEDLKLSIINALGQIVQQKTVSKTETANPIKIDIARDKAGLYTILDSYGNYVRFVKQ